MDANRSLNARFQPMYWILHICRLILTVLLVGAAEVVDRMKNGVPVTHTQSQFGDSEIGCLFRP
jgi:hypothetical protein